MARAISEIRTDLDAAKAKTRRILDEIDELGRKDALTDGEEQRYERLRAGFRKSEEEASRFADEWRDALEEGIQGGKFQTVPGTPFGFGDGQGAGVARRDTALRHVEQAERAGHIPTRSADRVDALLRTGTPGSRQRAAKWAEAAGDPHYLSAFNKLLADPNRGHLRFTEQEADAYRRAALVGDELRAMSTANTAGQELLPLSLDPTILLTNDGSINPIRANSRVVQVATNKHRVVTSGGAVAEWKTESAEAADGSPALAEVDIDLFVADVNVTFSYELAWSTADLIGELQPVIVDAMNLHEATAFTIGTGSGQPQGLVTGLTGTSSEINSTGTEALIAADAYALQNALPARFSPRAAWYGALPIMNMFRQLETANGSREFPGLFDSPPTLLGRRWWETSDMDDTINTAATESNMVLVYGDLMSAYVICDRIGSFLELTTKLGASGRPTGQRNMTLWRMTGAKVVRSQAARMLDLPTTA